MYGKILYFKWFVFEEGRFSVFWGANVIRLMFLHRCFGGKFEVDFVAVGVALMVMFGLKVCQKYWDYGGERKLTNFWYTIEFLRQLRNFNEDLQVFTKVNECSRNRLNGFMKINGFASLSRKLGFSNPQFPDLEFKTQLPKIPSIFPHQIYNKNWNKLPQKITSHILPNDFADYLPIICINWIFSCLNRAA